MTGVGGNPFTCSPPVPVCGNSLAEVSGPGDFICREDCDGADLGGETCESLGFRSGSLSCTTACRFDASKCESCAPIDAHLLACGTNRQAGSKVALAASDSEIAVAFVRDGGLWVEILAPDLSILQAPNRIASLDARNLDLLATPGGWLLAALSNSLDVYVLDGSGAVVSSSEIASGLVFGQQTFTPGVKLVSRPASGAFVLWQTTNDPVSYEGLYTVPLAPDGSALAAPARIGTLRSPVFAAAPTPTGMLVVVNVPVMDGSGNSELVSVRVDASGAPASEPRIVEPLGEYPTLAPASDGDVVLLYEQPAPTATAKWAKLDPNGTPRVGPIALDPSQLRIGATPTTIVPMAADYVVVSPFAAKTKAGVSLLGISGEAILMGPAMTVVESPRSTAAPAARCGAEIVVATQMFNDGAHSFELARIAP
jgi:hypothetical protein